MALPTEGNSNTYVKVAGRWTYLYRAVDQHGQVIDVLLSTRRNAEAARAFFTRALAGAKLPVEVTTDRAPVYPRVLDALAPRARQVTEQYANNVIEADHGLLKARLRPMRGLKRLPSARTIAAGHAFVQNLRRGHYELTTEQPVHGRVRVAFDELALCLWSRLSAHTPRAPNVRDRLTQQSPRELGEAVQALS